MKYVVSGGATLSFADGTKFELKEGIHDSDAFPDSAKEHWAFAAYVRPLDASDLAKEQQGKDQVKRIASLEAENSGLKAQLEDRDTTIAEMVNEIIDLKAQLEDRDTTSDSAGDNAPADTAKGAKSGGKK